MAKFLCRAFFVIRSLLTADARQRHCHADRSLCRAKRVHCKDLIFRSIIYLY
jgi:hypothetical protein